MDIAIVVPRDTGAISGGTLYDHQLAKHLRTAGHAVDVVPISTSLNGRRLIAWTMHHRDHLSSHDLIIEDGLVHRRLIVANRFIDAPTVGVMHMAYTRENARRGSAGSAFLEWVEAQFLTNLDGVVYTSASSWSDNRRLAPRTPAVVIPPGGDRLPATNGAPMTSPAERLDVIYVGTVVERKGLDIVVDALIRLDHPWALTVVGDLTESPDFVTGIRRRIETANVDDAVTWTGVLSDRELANRMQEAHVLAMPSRYEPFGMAYLEAMGAGTVPIATNQGGPREFITHGQDGFVVPPTVEAVQARLATCTDEDRLAPLAGNARETFESHPTWAEQMGAVAEFLGAVVERS